MGRAHMQCRWSGNTHHDNKIKSLSYTQGAILDGLLKLHPSYLLLDKSWYGTFITVFASATSARHDIIAFNLSVYWGIGGGQVLYYHILYSIEPIAKLFDRCSILSIVP